MTSRADLLVLSRPTSSGPQFLGALERQREWPLAFSTASAIQRLSPDILYEIFAYCVPSDLSDELSRVAPFNFSTVCRSWRAVVLGAPSLWASLSLNTGSIHRSNRMSGSSTHECSSCECAGRMPNSLARWLKLSKESPLDIKLFVMTELSCDLAAELVEMLLQQQHRWRNCDFTYFVNQRSARLSGIEIVNLFCPPHLKSLKIIVINGTDSPFKNHKQLLDTQYANGLSSLSVSKVLLSQPVGRMESLAELNIFEINLSGLFELLHNTPNLTRFVVGIHGRDDVGSDSTSRIVLNKLNDCRFRLNPDSDELDAVSLLLNSLFTPSLQTLELGTFSRDELPASNVWVDLEQFLKRSRPPLEKLLLRSRDRPSGPRRSRNILPRLYENPLSDNAIISMLEGLPILKELEVGGDIASAHLFDALSRDRDEARGDILCPLLRVVFEEREGYDWFELLQTGKEAVGVD